MIPPVEWMADALCARRDVRWPKLGTDEKIMVCQRCPVVNDCALYVLQAEAEESPADLERAEVYAGTEGWQRALAKRRGQFTGRHLQQARVMTP